MRILLSALLTFLLALLMPKAAVPGKIQDYAATGS